MKKKKRKHFAGFNVIIKLMKLRPIKSATEFEAFSPLFNLENWN